MVSLSPQPCPIANHEVTGEETREWCTHELFERQAAQTPDAVALAFASGTFSYRQLNAQANQLAHYLRRQGVGPEVLVGIALERSPRLVVALLAVWKAGGAYVPLDPGYPAERLAFMVHDAKLPLLITEEKFQPLFATSAARAICLDGEWAAIVSESVENPMAGATPGNLAYAMYTSGSTGQPKGALILHRGLVNYLSWAIETYGFEAKGSVPLHSSIAFDLTVTSLYPPLLVGGQVELLTEDVGAQSLVTALQGGKHYNVVKITPAHLELLSQQLSPEEMATMSRVFVIGGEQLLAESLRPWRRHAPGTRLFNEYGPTETVVGCCVHEVHAADAHQGAIPIGRPIANTRLYILDDELQPVPPGVVGELYIGGAGVARGYLNRPKVTEERFLPDPFSPAADDRLYKTGDLARQREDGSLEYLGRLDSQVKVRGYRVELGEIEASLALHPEVKSCVVLAPETSPGDRQLAVYVIPGTRPPSPRALQDHLRQRLPEFMVPDRMVFLETFPLTPNGKLDREALLALPLALMSAEPATRPATPVESSLLTIWNDLLRLDRLGIDEDLFVLGARSLQAVRAVTRIRTTFDVDLQLRHLFEQPTIAGQAKIIEGLQWLAASKMTRTRPHVLEEIEL